MNEARINRIEHAASTLDLRLSGRQLGDLSAYLDLLQRWNRTYNLTAIRDEEQMLVQHLFDSLAVIAPLRVQHTPSAASTVLDVGSGGGLPGVVIAICAPEMTVTCIDTVGKKAAFVRHVAGDLRLPNLHAVHGRVEAMRAANFDVVTARAFSTLGSFVDLTRPLLKEAGVWMALKGRVPRDEIAQLPAWIDLFHVEQLRVPDLDAERCIVWMRQRRL